MKKNYQQNESIKNKLTLKDLNKKNQNLNKFVIKQKILNHFTENGNKQTSEKILGKTLKSIQKSKKQSHAGILRLAIQNAIPVFRVVKLKSKKKKRNSQSKEIPKFVSHYCFRSSWALKNIVTYSKTSLKVYYQQLKQEILLTADYEGKAVNIKNELQEKVQEKSFFFRRYRW